MPRGNDPTAASELADQYGSGAGNAEALIDANALRMSEELRAAQMLTYDPDATNALDLGKVADVAGVDKVLSAAVRGDYVVFVAEAADGRVFKDVLRRDGEDLEAIEVEDSPARAQLRAQVEASRAIKSAEAEAERIRAEARAKADEILGQAQADAEAARAEAEAAAHAKAAERAEAEAEEADDDGEKAISKMNKAELQDELGAAGLDTEGTVPELRERLEEHRG